MTIEELKKEMAVRGLTGADLAQKLAMGKTQVYDILKGKKPFKETLQRHLELLFSAPQNAVLVYKISLTDKQVEELTGGQQFPATPEGEARKAAAVEAVLLHNMQTLIDLGRKVDLPDDMKGLLLLFGETWEEKEDEKGGQP